MRQSTMMATLLVALGLGRATTLQAQSSAVGPANDTAARLAARSRERAVEWHEAAPVVHCAPAPLIERPGASAEVARPRVAPLEQAFLDAALVRREVAAQAQTAVKRP